MMDNQKMVIKIPCFFFKLINGNIEAQFPLFCSNTMGVGGCKLLQLTALPVDVFTHTHPASMYFCP